MKKIPNRIGASVVDRMEALKIQFVEIAPSVTPQMRAAVAVKMIASDTTVKRYLKGDVARLDFGERMFKELKRQISEAQPSAIAS